MVWVNIVAAVVLFLLLKELMRLPTVGKYGEHYVFITGCDTGFGNLLAKRLDSMGFNVFAACFSEKGADKLRKVSSARLKTLWLDVTKTESINKARENVEKELPEKKGLWALVNNAGVLGSVGQSEWLTRADYDACVSFNLFGVIDVTRAFQPLVRKGQGRIVNMASVNGRLAVGSFPYVVSKYGVEAFSDCLRREVLKQGLTLHIIEPGIFNTNIVDADRMMSAFEKSFHQASPEVQNYYGKTHVEEKTKVMRSTLAQTVSNKTYLVVDAYVHAITAKFPRYRYLVGSDAKYIFRLLWSLPECISDFVLNIKDAVPAGAK